MKKIALVLTGGTIGSMVSDRIIDIGEQSVYQLVDAYEREYKEKEIFEVFSPFQALSENFTKKEWQMLYDFMYDFPAEDYAGIVIAHGTDTLAYTASLIGMLFGHLEIPIVFIASNYPVGQPWSNGLHNLYGAVSWIRQQAANGVYVVYENAKEQLEVHLATRLLPADNYEDQYGTFGGSCFGIMKYEEEVVLRKEDGTFLAPKKPVTFVANEGKHNPAILDLGKQKEPFLKDKICFEEDVLLITPYPGLNYSHFYSKEHPAAVYHSLYHAGTACVTQGAYSFLSFAQQCREDGIPLYIGSIKARMKNCYASGDAILQTGVKPLYDISTPSAYMKLILAYNQKEKKVDEVLEHVFFYENVES